MISILIVWVICGFIAAVIHLSITWKENKCITYRDALFSIFAIGCGVAALLCGLIILVPMLLESRTLDKCIFGGKR